jgi:putative drug exporter of the RND superfamily
MAKALHRLGSLCYRRRKLTIAVWLVVLVVFAIGALTLSGPSSTEFSIPGTEAQKAIDLLGTRFPQLAAQGATAQVVFAAPEGQTLATPDNQAAIEQVVARLKAGPQVARVVDPFEAQAINQAGTIGYAQVAYTVSAIGLTTEAQDSLKAAVTPGRDAGLTVEIGGDALTVIPEMGAADASGVGIAALVLLITFGSLIAAGMPLVTAILGVGITMAIITTLSGFIDIQSTTPTLAVMIGLAVAIDYALLIVSRFRHEIAIGKDPSEAIGHAMGTAGSTVVFAGLTVVIALCGLVALNIGLVTSMGLFAALGVVIAVVIALTALPALLGFAGRRVLAGRIPGMRARDPEADSAKPAAGERWGGFVVRRRVPLMIAAVVLLIGLAIPVAGLRMALPDNGTAGPDTTQRKAYDLLAQGFGPGFNGPLTVVVDAGAGATSDAKTAAAVVSAAIKQLGDVVMVTEPMFNETGNTAVLSVIPKEGPSSQSTTDLVKAIRGESASLHMLTRADILVTGKAALDIDMSAKLNGALPLYLLIVVGLAFIVLTMAFRSLVIPLIASLGFLLSVLATLGVVVAVFQQGWLGGLFGIVKQPAPIMSVMPILLVGIVFGLAMDYQVFLVVRMREEYIHGASPRQAVISGLSHGARVVTAAALIMISVFAGFGVFAGDPTIVMIGLGLACAILLDAFVVRMTIVPAVMALLGRKAWWLPAWLDRALPDFDVEGKNLRRTHEHDHGADLGADLGTGGLKSPAYEAGR